MPGAGIEEADLQPGRMMRTAGFGALTVISSRWVWIWRVAMLIDRMANKNKIIKEV